MGLKSKRLIPRLLVLVFGGSFFFLQRADLYGEGTFGQGGDVPKISIVEAEYDVGTIYRGTPIVHYFTIRNEGDGFLTISDIERDCGCTEAKVDSKAVPPKGETRLKVAVNTREQVGEIEKSVRLTSNDPDNEVVVVKIRGKVLISSRVEPSRVVLGEYFRGDLIPVQTVKIYPVAGFEDLEIVDLVEKSRYIQAEVRDFKETGGYIQLVIKIDSETPNNFIIDQIRLLTNRNEEPVIEIPVKVMIKQPYEVNPDRVIFYTLKQPKSITQNVQILNNEERPLSILDVEKQSEYLETEVVTREEGKNYVLKISLKPGFSGPRLKDTVTIHTDHPALSEKEVAVYIVNRFYQE